MEKAISLDKNNCTYLLELASQKLSQEKIKEASKCFSAVFKIDEANMNAMIGKLKCQIMENKLDDVARQIELLEQTQQDLDKNPEFPFLKAILNKKNNKGDKNIKLIDESITCHFKALKVKQIPKESVPKSEFKLLHSDAFRVFLLAKTTFTT